MTAPTRPWAAHDARKAWRHAADIRDEWLAHGLSTEDADRAATEQSLSTIYRRLHRPPPRFIWVDSPAAALPHLDADVDGHPTHEALARWIRGRRPPGAPPLASDLAAAVSRLRSTLEEDLMPPSFDPPPPKRKKGTPWPVLPPDVAIDAGIPFPVILRQSVRDVTWARLATRVAGPVRAALAAGRPLPVHWYGQHEAGWIAYFDVLRRLALVRFPRREEEHFDDWATLTRSCGWWWPGESTCVVVERPAEQRATVRYRDGYTVQLAG